MSTKAKIGEPEEKEVLIFDPIGNKAGFVERDDKLILCSRYEAPAKTDAEQIDGIFRERKHRETYDVDVPTKAETISKNCHVGRLTSWLGLKRLRAK